jgi:hypothetical protein
MGVAGGQEAVRSGMVWVFLRSEEQLRYCLVKAPPKEMRGADCY